VKALAALLDEARALVDALGRAGDAVLLERLKARWEAQEWYVLLVGETSSGKSTWVNTILGEALLPATPGATTGVPVEIRIVDDVKTPLLHRLDRDGTSREVDRGTFRRLCVTPDPTLARLTVAWPASACAVPADQARGLVIVDAPGFNSCVQGHTEVLLDVLPEADAVVFFLSFVRGFTPEDRSFLEAVVRGGEEPLFAVNWMSPSGGVARLAERERKAAPLAPNVRCLPLSPTREGGRICIWSDVLWTQLLGRARDPRRSERAESTVRALAASIVDDSLSQLYQRARIVAGGLEQRAVIVAELESLRRKLGQVDGLVSEGIRTFDDVVDETLEVARDRLWGDVDRQIEDAGRFTAASETSAWIRDHVVQHSVHLATEELRRKVSATADVFAARVEEFLGDADVAELPRIEVLDPQWASVRDHLARKGVREAGRLGAQQVFRAFGGAAGPKAGFVNFAKSAISKVGRVFGKTFSRQFYNGLGRLLTSIGLNAAVATAAFAAILVVAVGYLYGVIRWKASLRGVVQHTLGMAAVDEPLEAALLRRLPWIGGQPVRPLDLLASETKREIRTMLDETRVGLAMSIGRSAENLEKALVERGLNQGVHEMVSLNALRDRATQLREKLGDEQGANHD
jgi:hypothetical protein